MADFKDNHIAAQTAAKIAGDLLVATINSTPDFDSNVDLNNTFREYHRTVFESINELVAETTVTAAFSVPAEPAYGAPAAAPVAAPAPPVDNVRQMPPPPPPPAPAGTQGPSELRCPDCGGPCFDDRNRNAYNRANGFKLGHDGKCKDQSCGKRIWPDDYRDHANKPQAPRR